MNASPFFQACGGREAIRFAVEGGATLAFSSPVILAGSDPRCDIVLPQGHAAKTLAFILFGGRLFAMPLAELILRNGEACDPDWVEDGDSYEFDGLAVQPLNPEQPGSNGDDRNPLSSDSQRETDLHFEPLRAVRGKKAPRRLAVLPRLTLIGRAEPAKFKINYEGVEPIHAAVLRTATGPWLIDLTLRNGTLVNDGPVSAAKLRSGDRVAIGGVEMIAHVGPQDRPVPSAAAVPLDATVGPILQHVAQFQQQTFDQFREMLGSVTQMFGSVLSEHRQFVREELARLERATATPPAATPQLTAAPPAVPPPPAFTPPATITAIPAPGPGMSAPPPNVELHSWLSEQLGILEKNESSRWQRLVERFRKK